MKINIAIVDENEIFRKGLVKAMETHRDINIVIKAVNGPDLIAKLNHFSVDVILLEFTLKQMNTIETINELRKKEIQAKIIILTNTGVRDDIISLLYAKVNAYLLKDKSNEIYKAIISCISKGFYTNELCYVALLENLHINHELNTIRDKSFASLTSYDKQIIQLVCEGKTSTEIGKIFTKSRSSIEKIRAEINTKIGVKTLAELIKYAYRNKIIH